MLPPVRIDISDFVREWRLSGAAAATFAGSILNELGVRFVDQLKVNAGRELRQTRQEYQRAIYMERPDEQTLIIGLAGWLANAIEQGIGPFDMKEGFKRSDKVQFSKSGMWYMTIPFRHGIESTLGDSSVFSTIMPASVHAIAKQKLRDSENVLTLKDLPPEMQLKNVRREVTNLQTGQIFREYQHKSPIYEGMRRFGNNRNSQYVTFRRVGEMSDRNSWVHSGITAHNLFAKTLQSFPVADIVSQVKEDFLEKM